MAYEIQQLAAQKAQEHIGRATISPDAPIIAGSYGTWQITYTAGDQGIAPGGRIRIYTDSDTDWGLPQVYDPVGADYFTVQSPEHAPVDVVVQHIRSLMLIVRGDGLAPGEQIVVTYGDRSGGGPGARAQTFFEKQRYFWLAADVDGSGDFATLSDSPWLPIIGGDPYRLIVLVPSTAAVNGAFRMQVRVEDAWGNPSVGYRGAVQLDADGFDLPETQLAFSEEDDGVRWLEGCTCTQPGLHYIHATDGELNALSNPLLCREDAAGDAALDTLPLSWGDFHGGQLTRAEKILEFFSYARNIAGIDFASYQRNDHLVTTRDWALQQQAEKEFHEPGRFVPIPGFEWSPQTELGGHHNVFFYRHDQPIRRSDRIIPMPDADPDTDLKHVVDFFNAYRGQDVVITPHVGGHHSDLDYHDPNLEPAVEITSTHGTFEWMMEDVLERGYKLGFLGGSDSFTGRPGADRPGHQLRRYAKAGLTGIYAESHSVAGFLDALKARRCYATTGARILVRAESDGHPMGSEYNTYTHPQFTAFIAGTAPIESVELFRGLEPIHYEPAETSYATNKVRILWDGSRGMASYSGVHWDGRLAVRGAKILNVETLRFDSPRSHLLDVGDSSLAWHSVACGYPSGLVLELDDDDAELLVTVDSSLIVGAGPTDAPGLTAPLSYAPSQQFTFRANVRDLQSGPETLEIGYLNRTLTAALAPQDCPMSLEFSFTDSDPEPGINPYWVRVMQTDMEMAWSSPVYVHYTDELD